MTELKIEVTIDGTPVTQAELAKVQESRIKHVLNEMKTLGAAIAESHTEINWLSYSDAKQLLLTTKAKYADLAEMKALYQSPLASSDRFWKDVAAKSNGTADLQEGQVMMHVEGITMPQLQKVMGSELGSDFAAIINPEHFYSVGNTVTGQHIIETFGCFGEPTEMTLYPEKGDFKPTTPDPSYPIQMGGYVALASDDDDLGRGWRAYHQIRPTATGFDAILAAYLPSATPTEIINGHKWHLAVEFSEMVKYAVANG
ncbi:hypothetical protein [Lactobacillus plantarum subsp. plantarum] [Lactiplantibacillus mudanjiangensis]|uniref:hypothetical protein n=1 Tax=Lactiplantibacillus mudanjiangensis TaxID=1296538 RepID=UPI0010159082|nr:hypothetical protein [Lactobacillus plantarum subsp. plantarum] [Lactiplantibacillus mudanjiangensis]